jgi:hypothetical protein
MNYLRNLWTGNQSLVRAFWGSYLLGSMLVAGGIGGIVSGIFIVLGQRTLGYVLAAVLFTPYCVIATVGVWRSANNYPLTRWWPNLAKFMVIIMTPVFFIWVIRLFDPTFQIGPR